MEEQEPIDEEKKPGRELPFHIGRVLHELIRRKNLKQAEVARKAFMSPQALSGALHRPSMQLEILYRLCLATRHDLFRDLSQLVSEKLMEQAEGTGDPLDVYVPPRIRYMVEVDSRDTATIAAFDELVQRSQQALKRLP